MLLLRVESKRTHRPASEGESKAPPCKAQGSGCQRRPKVLSAESSGPSPKTTPGVSNSKEAASEELHSETSEVNPLRKEL